VSAESTHADVRIWRLGADRALVVIISLVVYLRLAGRYFLTNHSFLHVGKSLLNYKVYTHESINYNTRLSPTSSRAFGPKHSHNVSEARHAKDVVSTKDQYNRYNSHTCSACLIRIKVSEKIRL